MSAPDGAMSAPDDILFNGIPLANWEGRDPFDDDEPLACGIENPDQCESCT